METPWAVLLTKFNDNSSEPFPRGFYEDLFTRTGVGSQNMVDFFRDVSHGTVDLSGSQVFGWLTLDKSSSEYTGSGANPAGRDELVNWAKQAATKAGYDLSGFFGVVVCLNVPVDLFGVLGQGVAVCNNLSMQPSILGQEMGHGYGLDHSRASGSDDDYRDRWDTMSTWDSVYMAPHDRYQLIGPSLNAWNMRGRGWLDESRVWKGGTDGYDETIQLRPLVRRDLPGLLAADLGNGQLVEFRVQEGWDAAIPRPAVLIHHFRENHSYIEATPRGSSDLVQGDTFELGADTPFTSYRRVEILSIDAPARIATLRLVYRPALRIPYEGLGGTVLGGVIADGGGAIIVGGSIIPIPPWDPMLRVLEQVALYRSSALTAQPRTRDEIRREALTTMADHVGKVMEGMSSFRVPAPLSDREHE